ncbi:hypothetical protein ACG1VR_18515 [Cedecea davisae]|uniref:hypothetical protein n=1 Tax=Cedecea davisae TaxID=158484 RepID=UPI00376F165F
MNRKYIFGVVIVFSVLSVIVGFFYGEHVKTKDGLFCTTDISIHSGNNTLSMTLNYHMQSGVGYMTLEGVLYNYKHKISNVSLLKHFRYSESDGEFLLTQIPDGVLEVSEADKSILEEYIPDFYLTNKIPTHHIRIKQLRKGLWIFTTEPVPYFVCAEY